MRDLPALVLLASGLVLGAVLLGIAALWLLRLRPLAKRTEAWRAMAAALDLRVAEVSSRWVSPALHGERGGIAIECLLVPIYRSSRVATVIVASFAPPLDVDFLVETTKLPTHDPRGLPIVSLGVAGLDARCRVRAGNRGRLDDFVRAGAGDTIARFLDAMPSAWELRLDDSNVVLTSGGMITDASFLGSALDETAKLVRALLDLRSRIS